MGCSRAQQHLAARGRDRLVGARVLVLHAAVDLAARRGADVEALGVELAEVARRVGARRHRLRLERFELGVGGGAELPRHDAAQVLLERHLVDDVEGAAVVEVDEDAAAVTVAADEDAGAVGVLDREPASAHRHRQVALQQPQRGVADAAALAHHPGVADAEAGEAAPRRLRRLAARVAADAHAVEAAFGLEHRVGGLAGGAAKVGRERLGLAGVAQGSHLDAEDAGLGALGRGVDAQGAGERPGLPFPDGTQPGGAAGEGDAALVGEQADAEQEIGGGRRGHRLAWRRRDHRLGRLGERRRSGSGRRRRVRGRRGARRGAWRRRTAAGEGEQRRRGDDRGAGAHAQGRRRRHRAPHRSPRRGAQSSSGLTSFCACTRCR